MMAAQLGRPRTLGAVAGGWRFATERAAAAVTAAAGRDLDPASHEGGEDLGRGQEEDKEDGDETPQTPVLQESRPHDRIIDSPRLGIGSRKPKDSARRS
jgi:hypothetical protein